MRKPFLDNLRYTIVLLVVFYHAFYLFNSVGVLTSVAIPGIPALDLPLYLLYPWFMAALFVISGICARYSLQKQTGKAFLKTKLRRQLLPSVAIVFLIGWSTGWVTAQYADMFGTFSHRIPGFAKYLIWSASGIGPLWFLHQLLVCEAVLVLLRHFDSGDRIWALCGKLTLPALCLLFFPLWGSAQILNMPVIEIYRTGFYLFCYLSGYYIFSHERIQNLLCRVVPALLAACGLLAAAYTLHFWGENYAAMDNLKHPLTNAYAWFGVLGVLGSGRRWLNRETAFTRFLAPRSFGIYVLHYPVMVLCCFLLDRYLSVPVWGLYLLLPVLVFLLLLPLLALLHRIPLLRVLVSG